MPKPKPRKVLCDCGKRFIDSQSRSRHIRDSPLHQQPVTAAADTDATPALAGESDETQELATGKEIESVGRLYTTKAIAGKGKGLVAATKILKGTRILSEAPMFRVPRDNSDIEALERIVAKEVECLNKDQQHTFFDLANIYGNAHSRPLGIARTNILPLGSKASSGGLFPEASRINHSCRHNSQNTWNENIGRLTIHALRDIEEGEEITITYLTITSEYADRQRFLKEKFKFDCKCELCSLPRAQQKRSDARLREIQTIDSSIGNFFWGGLESERALHLLHKMFGLFEKEDIWDGSISRAYKDAYDIAIESGDKPRARVFAERTYDARRLIEGDDSPVTMRMKQVAEGLSAEAQGLSGADFENWLWMLPS
jgi:hypothetical protein